jgi:putative transcriptional regulator
MSDITPLIILRTILCATPTAEQVEAALAANGFQITASPPDEYKIVGRHGWNEYTTAGIGARIRELREGRSWSQADLAERLEVSVQAISQWETEKHSPTIDNVVAAAELFGVPPHAILWDEATAEPIDDPIAFVREILSRRGISATALASAAGLAASTLNRALNKPDHKNILSTRTLQKIRDWDRSHRESAS